MFEILGIVGIAISVSAYVPQVVHLAREHCSAGVSSRAWVMWLASSLLVGMLAVHRRDPVFIMLQACTMTSAALILFLARRYRGMACELHAPPGSHGGPVVPVDGTMAQPSVVVHARNRTRPAPRVTARP